MDTETLNDIQTYIDRNPIATLGTINADGSPQGAVVYICADSRHPIVYFITKQATKKYENLIERNHVSLTIVNPKENSTLQSNGRAFEVQDPAIIDMVMGKIAHEHASATEWLPPIAKLRAGAYVIIGIELTHARLAQFKGMVIGDEHIFTKL
jgi:general stress protein 26